MAEKKLNNQAVVDTSNEQEVSTIISEEHLEEDYNELMTKIEKDISSKTEDNSISPANVGNNLKAVLQFLYKNILLQGIDLSSISNIKLDGIDLIGYVKEEELKKIITDFINKEDLNKKLQEYITNTILLQILSDYVKREELSNYATTDDLTSYATKDDLSEYERKDTIDVKEAEEFEILSDNLHIRLFNEENGLDLKISPKKLKKYLKIQSFEIEELEGKRDGRSSLFTTSRPYVLGTSSVWLNGVRLFAGRSYTEVDTNTINFEDYIPKDDDDILLEAVFE